MITELEFVLDDKIKLPPVDGREYIFKNLSWESDDAPVFPVIGNLRLARFQRWLTFLSRMVRLSAL